MPSDRKCRQCGAIGHVEITRDHVSCSACGAVLGEVEWFPNVEEVEDGE